jgi:hypothetical protein
MRAQARAPASRVSMRDRRRVRPGTAKASRHARRARDLRHQKLWSAPEGRRRVLASQAVGSPPATARNPGGGQSLERLHPDACEKRSLLFGEARDECGVPLEQRLGVGEIEDSLGPPARLEHSPPRVEAPTTRGRGVPRRSAVVDQSSTGSCSRRSHSLMTESINESTKIGFESCGTHSRSRE